MPNKGNQFPLIGVLGIVYVIVLYLLDWNGTAVVVGALLLGLVAVVTGYVTRDRNQA